MMVGIYFEWYGTMFFMIFAYFHFSISYRSEIGFGVSRTFNSRKPFFPTTFPTPLQL
jgi:hypothetical protein